MPRINVTQSQIRESDEKRREQNRRRNAKTRLKTQTYTVRVYHGSELETAIEKAAADAGKQPGRYLREALIEKLRRNGYLTEPPAEDDE